MNIDLGAIEARYTPEPVPFCAVCAAELTMGSIGGGLPTVWICQSASTRLPDGRTDWDHISRSTFTQRRTGDFAVLALVAEARRLRTELASFYAGCPCSDCAVRLRELGIDR